MAEHPEYFLSLPRPPYPNYRFSGADLSSDPRMGIYLEDGYYDRSDAAVVFLRKDRETGADRYVYHGNDGTAMPWNDTAQLDFMKEEVREAVIRQIIKVAETFPIIRFDAAMTLARKHVQRLWYPKPGDGGAVPSRSEYGMSEREFAKRMPEEFWREVVDRIRVEAPQTLLLAEAFWMMEGYFVRNLGMHRVYNSAFMNLLKTEDNREYRRILKETLSRDPRILKRFVNFMNNPDEDTAVSQFGRGDKYFGICTLLVTLPGLPMIGHGQFEGLAEKYGMEYRRSYFDESPDEELLARHEKEIYPLMKSRLLFAGARRFHLFDYYRPQRRQRERLCLLQFQGGTPCAGLLQQQQYPDRRARPQGVPQGGRGREREERTEHRPELEAERNRLYPSLRDQKKALVHPQKQGHPEKGSSR